MKAETIIWLLAAGLLLCLAVLLLSTVYFLYQWRKLDRILEEFSRGTASEENRDMLDTRESRVVSQLNVTTFSHPVRTL